MVLGTLFGSGRAEAGAPASARPAPSAVEADAPPTPLEQALVEHLCRIPGQAMLAPEAYEGCLRDQLVSLRSEFGKDLRKLSAPDRRTIDKACSALRVERGRDDYIACLSARLTGLILSRGHTPPTIVTAVAPAAVADVPIAPSPADLNDPAVAPTGTGGSTALLIGGLVLLMAGGGAWFVLVRRRARPVLVLCRICGELANTGDLCAACRHDAAETQRRAVAERSAQLHSLADAARRAEEQEDVPSSAGTAAASQATPTAVDDRGGEREEARQAQIEREREAARRRDADRRRWEEAAAAAIAEETPIDPGAILGVPADASPEQIRTAYEAARQKYAPEQVAHLGSELQDHYRTKAQAVERAFELLGGVAQPS